MNTINIPGRNDMTTFNVRIARAGEITPLGGHFEASVDIVEFYDARFTKNFTELGQFVSSYRASMIAESDDGGLCLDGANSDVWSVGSVGMNMVRDFIKKELS